MKRITIFHSILFFALSAGFVSCEKSGQDELYFKGSVNETLTSFSILNEDTADAGAARHSVDINEDGIIDYDVVISHSFANPEWGQNFDEYKIFIGSENFNEVSIADAETGIASFYVPGDEMKDDFGYLIEPDPGFGNLPKAYLYKQNETDTLLNTGDLYLGLKMSIEGAVHYGWILLHVTYFEVTIKEYSVSRKPEVLIKVGEK